MVGFKTSSTRSSSLNENEGQMNQPKTNETACKETCSVKVITKSVGNNVISSINKDENTTKDLKKPDHKSLVLSEMKKAMRHASVINIDKHKSSLENPSSITFCEPRCITSNSLHLRKICNCSPDKSLPRACIMDAEKKDEVKSPTKRKIVESLVDEMVKEAFHSVGSDKKADESTPKCVIV